MRVVAVDTFVVTTERSTPYLGPLGVGETVNSRGYFVRQGNGTIYPTVDRSIVVRLTTDVGAVGWGETYGICAPKATCEIINDLLAPVLIGAEPERVEQIWDELYGLMRVRGCTSGFHGDAIAALDIALWDLCAKAHRVPLRELLGSPQRETVPGYVSGLPAASLVERVNLAKALYALGHRAFKFAAAVSHEGVVEEMAALRTALGPDAEIMVDMHWKFSAEQALQLIERLKPFRPRFVEAPVKPEDIAGLARVVREANIPIAAGEEWYNEYEFANRLAAGRIDIVQPEMGHTGVTQFRRIAALAARHSITVAPHATIGTGLFLAASLQTAATLPNLWIHEWQHSVFDHSLALLETDMAYAGLAFRLPSGVGIGAEPSKAFWRSAVHVH
jgi:L-alanine-DL-glutamate epimerase-like enolase superfamily enzyme